ncbi:DUF4431 domain-containing protein [Pseudomonas sp. GV071]|uniref:DUF4431 domain-containing protein n=1 Tax=Pseudomonas sp. GV071 TaxID=2135754 RepID=UPI000D352678|nr:DUF4431 domain-containing protein [Pseudomonas sp. GV071]PTQ73630.1 uncharacterized protein DUF4431 [Pseudomonas sp. GV071]
MPFSPRRCALLALVASLLQLPVAQAADCHVFETETLTLTGTLYPDTFPGAPGFEDVTQGDEAEVGFYLALPEPLCMTPNDEFEVSSDQRLDYLQLILDQKGYDQLRPYLLSEGKLTVKGSITGALTGHHHTPLLLQDVEFVSGTPTEPVDCELLAENASLDERLPSPLPGKITGEGRLYFHTAPNESCGENKAYIVPGDVVSVTNIHSFGWANVTYTSKKGTEFSGWVKQGQVLINGE